MGRKFRSRLFVLAVCAAASGSGVLSAQIRVPVDLEGTGKPIVVEITVPAVRRIVRGSISGLRQQFQQLERENYEIDVEGCEFYKLSPAVVRLRLRKLEPGRTISMRTEALLGTGYTERIRELESQGKEVRVACFQNFPFWLGEHAVIQYKP